MTCPDKECHKKVDGHHTSLFGEDGLGGLAGCLKKMVSWRSLGLISALVIPLVVGYVYYSAADSSEKKVDIALNTKKIAVTAEQVNSVKADIKEIKDVQATILNRQFTLEQLKRVIKEAINGNKEDRSRSWE